MATAIKPKSTSETQVIAELAYGRAADFAEEMVYLKHESLDVYTADKKTPKQAMELLERQLMLHNLEIARLHTDMDKYRKNAKT